MIDLVHDVTESYRELVHAFGYPGDIVQIDGYSKKQEVSITCYDHTFLIALMLLDQEVTFATVGDIDGTKGNQIQKMTYAKQVGCHDADYIFVFIEAKDYAFEEAIQMAKTGTLIDPQASATLICEIPTIGSGFDYDLRGPGIKDKKAIQLVTIGEWLSIRNRMTHEYPLGIDLIFVDAAGKIMALPRTTTIEMRTK